MNLHFPLLPSASCRCAEGQSSFDSSTIDGGSGTGDQYSALELQYIGNGDWFPLSYVGNLMPY